MHGCQIVTGRSIDAHEGEFWLWQAFLLDAEVVLPAKSEGEQLGGGEVGGGGSLLKWTIDCTENRGFMFHWIRTTEGVSSLGRRPFVRRRIPERHCGTRRLQSYDSRHEAGNTTRRCRAFNDLLPHRCQKLRLSAVPGLQLITAYLKIKLV